MRRAIYIATTLATSVATPTWAQIANPTPGQYSLAWVRGTGTEDCPPASELRREVERRIGRPLFDVSADETIEASVRLDDRSTPSIRRSEIHVRDANGVTLGERTLTSTEADCRPLFSSTALAIALLVDPEATALRESGVAAPAGPAPIVPTVAQPPTVSTPFATAQSPNSAAIGPAPPVEVTPNQPKASANGLDEASMPRAETCPAGTVTSERSAQMSLSALVGANLLPATQLGMAMGLRAWESPTIGWSVSAVYFPHAMSEQRNASNVAISLIALQPALMLELLSSDYVRLIADVGASVGALQLAVRGTPATGPNQRWFFAARTELAAQLKLSSKARVELAMAGIVPLVRNQLLDASQASRPLFEQPSIGAIGRIGIGLQIP